MAWRFLSIDARCKWPHPMKSRTCEEILNAMVSAAIRWLHVVQATPPPRDAMWAPFTGALTSSSSVIGHLNSDYQTGQAAPS